jgi:hypothetical protein
MIVEEESPMRELSKEEIELVAGGTVVQLVSQQNATPNLSTSLMFTFGSAFAPFAPSATTFEVTATTTATNNSASVSVAASAS